MDPSPSVLMERGAGRRLNAIESLIMVIRPNEACCEFFCIDSYSLKMISLHLTYQP